MKQGTRENVPKYAFKFQRDEIRLFGKIYEIGRGKK